MHGVPAVEIRVERRIPASPATVWAELRRIDRHVLWMRDAAAIRFLTDQREGVGTAFVCGTRVGPLRVRDRMEVTEWSPPLAMGVRHTGAVSGEGRFLLQAVPGGTVVTWVERLGFPWWLGGRVGAVLARPVLRWVWRRNLAGLAGLVAGEGS